MSKRVLSICLAVLIMAMAIPMSIFAPAVSAAQDGEINLSAINFPKWGIDKKIQDFEALTDTEKDVTVEVNNGSVAYVTTSANGHYVTGEDGNTRLASTAISDTGQPTIRIYYATPEKDDSAWPTVDSVMYAVHIDATEVANSETISTRLTIEHGTGSSSRSTYYALRNEVYYFLPDATESNPTPELETRRSTNVNSKDNVTVAITSGVAGTYYFPLSMFTYDGTELEDLPTYTDNSAGTVYSDKQSADNITVKEIYNYFNNWRHYSALCFNLRTQLKTGETVYFDNVCWMSENNLPYKTQLITEDFTDTDLSAVGSWSGSITSTDSITDDGRFAVTTTDGQAAGAYYAFQAKTIGAWPKNASAFAFDVDVSEIEGHQLRYSLRFYENGNHTTTEKIFMPANGNIYLVNDNGAVSTVAVGTKTDANYAADVTFPEGFKGTVIVPLETMRCASDKTVFSDALYDMSAPFAELEIRGYGTEDNVSIDDGKTIYFDNFAYYVEPEVPEAGTTFSATTNSSMNVEEYITEAVKTTEVWVKTTNGGTILNKKFRGTGAAYYTYNLNVGVNAAGNPYYNISDGNGGKNYGNGHSAECTFSDVTVNDGNWTHLAFVQKADSVDLYVNSALAGSVAAEDFDVIVNGKLTVGHIFGNEVTGKTDYFDGEIANLRLWNDVRTPAELYYNAVETPTDTTGLIAGWTLSGDTPFADVSGKGNDIVEYDYEISKDDAAYAELDAGASDEDGEYSIVFLPDTQIVNYHYPDQFPEVYDWVLANQDKYNIKAVMGLGDITDKNDDAEDADGDGTVTDAEAAGYGEWPRARAQFDRLTAAGIPWTIIPGNHDCKGASVGTRNYANLNAAFPLSEISQFAYFGGSFTESSVVNSYYYLTVGDVKYLLLCLDQEPRANAIAWANQVVAAHPDYRVIVTTHIYMTSQGVYYVPKGDGEVAQQPYSYTSFDTYESLWNGFLAKHANIDMVVCGHSSTPNILTRTDTGVNGNEVLQVIVDTQAIDYTYASASCVAVATFSADGNDVRWRLYSTAQEMFLDEDSQFATTLEGTVSEPIAETNSAADTFDDPLVIRDFTTFDLYPSTSSNDYTSTQITLGKGVSSNSVSMTLSDNAALVNRQLKLTPSEAGRIDIAFKQLPNLVEGNQYNAIAFYVDFSQYPSNKYPYFKLNFREKSGGSNETAVGSVYYALSNDGTLTKYENDSSWACDLPKYFEGYVIVPFDNVWSSGTKTANDFIQASQANSAEACLRIMENVEADYICFDNICYLKNFDPNIIGNEEGTAPTKNVELTDEITVNYKLDKATMDTAGYSNPRVEFEVNGVTTSVNEYTVEDGKYVFAFSGVNPKNIADNITVTYFATDADGVEHSTYKQNYSVKQYCDNILANYTGEDEAEVKEVIKGMLNFAAASQEYFGYNTDSLVNTGYEDYAAKRDYTNSMAITANANADNNSVKWKSAGLNFSSNVALRFNIEASDIEGLVVKAVVGEDAWYIPATAFSKVDGAENRYYVYFNKLSVACMSDTVDFTVYDANGTQVSDTLTYSIESYAAAKYQGSGAIANLVKTMMNYGDAAKTLGDLAATR